MIYSEEFCRIESEKEADFDLALQNDFEHERVPEDGRIQLLFADNKGSETVLPAHWHEHLELLYVTGGSITAYVDQVRYELEAGDILLINSNAIHYTHTHETTRYCLLQIPPVHLQRMAEDWQMLHFQEYFPAGGMDDCLWSGLRELFEEMKRLHTDPQPGNQLLLLSCLYRMLYLLFTGAADVGRSTNRDLERMKRCMEYIRSHYQEPITLADGAALLSVTPEHFCRLFKRYTGQTFLRYLGQVRMTHFYEDLAGEDKITLLLDRHGIRNYKVFLREFKKNYGRTPQQVRMEYHKMALS